MPLARLKDPYLLQQITEKNHRIQAEIVEASRFREAPDREIIDKFDVGDHVYVNRAKRATGGKYGIVPDIDLPDEPGHTFVAFGLDNEEVVTLPTRELTLVTRYRDGDHVWHSRWGKVVVVRVIYQGHSLEPAVHFTCEDCPKGYAHLSQLSNVVEGDDE